MLNRRVPTRRRQIILALDMLWLKCLDRIARAAFGARTIPNNTNSERAPKLAYIESLRGLAALQVLVLHYVSAFLPVLAGLGGYQHYSWEPRIATSPLFFLIDGYSSVYLFFVMSGFVLAPSFVHSNAGWMPLALKRFVRLFLPIIAACTICFLLLSLFPHAKLDAAAFSHSGWLSSAVSSPPKLLPSLGDATLNTMLLGYKDKSLFQSLPFINDRLSQYSLNPPLWTLHIEFWGSLLVLSVACLYRRLHRRIFWFTFFTVLVFTGTSEYSLFLIGFAIWSVYPTLWRYRGFLTNLLGFFLMTGGVWICADKNVAWLARIFNLTARIPAMQAQFPDNFHWQSTVGAVLVFVGVTLCAPIAKWISGRIFLWVGRLSFSIYLLHFPVMQTIGCLLFTSAVSIGYLRAFALALTGGLLCTLALAACFEKYIDRKSIMLAKALAQRVQMKSRGLFTERPGEPARDQA
jgi:peptidoglycan/LPS O-acetylase OafA/YrhL